MKTVIVYPVPMETPEVWALFKPFVERFVHSMKNTDPGCEYEIVLVLNYPKPEMPPQLIEIEEMFYGLPSKTRLGYLGKGCDIGSFQLAAEYFTENTFMVCCVSRVYAWKAGWLKRLVEAREKFGAGLYGTSASKEGGKLHVCCRCYAMDSDDFKRYPHRITSRDQGQFFECGDGCLYEWYKTQCLFGALIVHWDCTMRAYCDDAPNIYRRGDQSNLLVKDKHSLAYDEASPEEKRRLERMCFEGVHE